METSVSPAIIDNVKYTVHIYTDKSMISVYLGCINDNYSVTC